MTAITVLKPKYRVEECLAEIRECLESGWTGMGFKTDAFEAAWKELTGERNAHFVSSATAGLHLAIKYLRDKLGWQDDDEVISTPLTFVSSNHVILYERLKPVFADVDETLCLAPESVESRITPRTRAIGYVGIAGNPGHLVETISIAKKHNLVLILDAAHMAGSKIAGRHINTGLGHDCSVHSFHAVKNLPTADGGLVCFRDEADDRVIRKYSWLGIDKTTYQRSKDGGYSWQYDVQHVGLKAHGNSVMAAIGLVQLKYLEKDNAYRGALAACYDRAFADVGAIRTVLIPEGTVSSRHLYQIRVPHEQRDRLIGALRERNIHVGMHYMLNTRYPMYRFGWGTCPEAERAERELVSLPLHLNLSEEDVERVASSVVELLQKL